MGRPIKSDMYTPKGGSPPAPEHGKQLLAEQVWHLSPRASAGRVFRVKRRGELGLGPIAAKGQEGLSPLALRPRPQ